MRVWISGGSGFVGAYLVRTVPGVHAVARLAAVQGGTAAPRSQDAGFGYFVASLVRTLRAGERFTVWEGDGINAVATPTLADDAAALIARIVAGGHAGIFHCLDARATAAALGVELPDLDTQLRRLDQEVHA